MIAEQAHDKNQSEHGGMDTGKRLEWSQQRNAPGGGGPLGEEMLSVARATTAPGLVIAYGSPDAAGIPLLADRPLVDEGPAAYVCRGFVCDLPVRTVEELRSALSRDG